jgi:hypothetical protein
VEVQIPLLFFYLIGWAAVITAAGWAVPRVLRAWGELPPRQPDMVERMIDRLAEPTWQSGPPKE